MFLHWTPPSERNVNWQQVSTASTLYDIVYANGYYCAVGTDGATYFSTDRSNWSQYNISGTTTGDHVAGVTHNGSKFYAIYTEASTNTAKIVETTGPGVGWSASTGFSTGTGSAVGIKSDGAGITIAVNSGRDVLIENTPISSPWSIASDVYTSGSMNQLEFTSGTWWVTGTRYVYTGNGTGTWTRYDVTGGASTVFRGIVEDLSANLIVSGDGLYLSTNNGSTWSSLTAPSGNYNSIEYGDLRFLSVDTTTATIESTNASTFSTVGHTGTTADLNRVRWINGEFIAVGNGIWVLYAST